MRRAKLRKVYALLERRGFLAMLAARLMPRVPATGLHYVAGVAPVGVPAFAAAMALGALVRTAPYAVLGQGIGWVARHDPDRRKNRGRCGDGRGPGATPPNPVAAT
jgi:uncharacterized membrane protein YdjX (TVP38/TMEM64 family)